MLRVVGTAGSAQRWNFLTLLGRKAIEAVVLFLVVAALAQNVWLALTVAIADLVARPVADRVAAWGWQHLFSEHAHSHAAGHAD